jgi:hypothetical protein
MGLERWLSVWWPWVKPRISPENIHAITAPILTAVIDDYEEAGKLAGLQYRTVLLTENDTMLVVQLHFLIHKTPIYRQVMLPLADLLQGRKSALDDMIALLKAELDRDAETLHP